MCSSIFNSISPLPILVSDDTRAHDALLVAVHWQWDSVATAIFLCCFLYDTVNRSGVTAYVQAGNRACSTRNSRSPTTNAAVLAAPELAAAAILRVFDPVPLRGETVTQFGAPVTVQAHPAGVSSDTEIEDADADGVNAAGVRVTLQGAGAGVGAGGGAGG